MRVSRLALFLLSLPLLRPALAGTAIEPDRSLLLVRGTVAAIEETSDSSGATWTEMNLIPTGSSTPLHIRLAPSALLDAEAFRIAIGNTLQIRMFSDETPFAAQRIRNETTGRVLRVRCLHGQPLWGVAQGSSRDGDRGGPRHRGGR